MTGTLSRALLSDLSAFIADRLGLHFPAERWMDLERGIGSAARDFGFGDPEACIEWLMSAPLGRSQIETLGSHLTVGETYFFRHRRLFEILETEILPELISARRSQRRLRIWSAGCSTGEEPYSLAILLSRVIPDWKAWQITLLGTDINPASLHKASRGEYSEWSFRDNRPWLKEKYFTVTKGGRLALHPEIRDQVFFSHLNLAEDVYPSLANDTAAMDLIFCRNVLMYFTPERIGKVRERLGRSLVEGGWLAVSPIEASFISSGPFVPVRFPEAVLFRKDSSAGILAGLPSAFSSPERQECRLHCAAQNEPAPWLAPEERGVPSWISGPEVEAVPSTVEAEAPPENAARSDPYAEALALYERGRYAEAAEKLALRLSENGGDARAGTLLARIYANSGRLEEALAWSGKAIANDKLNAACHYLRALILQEEGRLEEAVASLRRALYLDQQFALAHFALANLSRRRGLPQESEKHFRNALAVLGHYGPDDILPESDGITAGRLAEIIRSTASAEGRA